MIPTSQYIIGIDVGSSNLKCEVFDKTGAVVSIYSKKITLNNPKPGHYELDPDLLWNNFKDVFNSCLEKKNLSLKNIRGVGISVQRNSFLLWDRKNSKPLTPIISWQDTRSSACVKSWNESWRLKVLNYSSKIAYLLTGSKRFLSASILCFKSSMVSIRLYELLKNDAELLHRARMGEICYGCIETWLLWCLTKGKEFSTDASCASITGIYDPFTCKWSDTLLNLFNLPKEILPEVKYTNDNFGETSLDFLISHENVSVPICCVIGDSQAATIGSGCINRGEGNVTLGTGSFLTINTGDRPHVSMTGLYPTIGCQLSEDKIVYFVEGYHPATGSTIEWLKNLNFFETYEELEEILNQHSNDANDGVYFVPAFMGFQVPLNDPSASGLLIGITPSTLRPSIVYAVAEAISMSIRWMLDAVQKETDIRLNVIRVNGNVAKSKWILQRLADLTKYNIEVCQDEEASCSGAAYLAGIKCGFWNYNEISSMCKIYNTYYPNNQSEYLEKRFIKWKLACLRALNWK